MAIYNKFKPNQLWKIKVANPSQASNMKVKFQKLKNGERKGFGIYAISYEAPSKSEYIIYLGKFSGRMTKNKTIDNAQEGDVRDRWFKHIGTASLLLAGLRMNAENAFKEHQRNAALYFQHDEDFKNCIKNSILGLNENQLRDYIFKKNGNQISNNRLGFAIQNLTTTNPSNALELDDLNHIISKFTCHYWQVTSNKIIKKSDIEPLIEGTNDFPGVEKIIIQEFKKKLPMNKEFTPSYDTNRQHYHYNPTELIEVGSDEFINFSKFVAAQLNEKFSKLI